MGKYFFLKNKLDDSLNDKRIIILLEIVNNLFFGIFRLCFNVVIIFGFGFLLFKGLIVELIISLIFYPIIYCLIYISYRFYKILLEKLKEE